MTEQLENVVKMIDEMYALDEFFNSLKQDYKQNLDNLFQNISDKYQLTDDQKFSFIDIASRTNNAIKIINYFEKRFGIIEKNEKRYFDKPEELYELLYNEKSPKLEAQSLGYAIKFIRENWTEKDKLGYVKKKQYKDDLFLPFDKLKNKLENNESNNCKNLAMIIPKNDYVKNKVIKKSSNEIKLLNKIFPEISSSILSHHELRHIIDYLIGKTGFFKETQAYLYQGTKLIDKIDLFEGLRIDYGVKFEEIDNFLKDYKEQIKNKNPFNEGFFSDIFNNRLITLNERIEKLEKEKNELTTSFNTVYDNLIYMLKNHRKIKDQESVKNYRALSYLFAVPDEQIPSRLHLLRQYLEKEI